MRTVTWAVSALQDFDEAISYIAKDDLRAAMRVADCIDQGIVGNISSSVLFSFPLFTPVL